MALKDLLAKLSQGKAEKSRKFRELEEDFILRKRLEEKQKSANERELEKFMMEEREAKIKGKLDKLRKREKDDLWRGNMIFGQKSTILDNDNSMLQSDSALGIGGTISKGTVLGIGGTKIKSKGMFFK